MKKFLAVMLLLVAVQMPTVHAAGPDDDYVAIYTMIQEGDALNEKGQSAAAIAKYAEAQSALKRFKTTYPEMYGKVVTYRLSYLENKITLLTSQPTPAIAVTNAAPRIPTNVLVPATPAIPVVAPESPVPPATELENQVKGLQDQVRRMEADHALLEAKLKEALAARPAELDPQELAKAREQVTTLQKENELLKANVESSKSNTSTTAASAVNLEKSRQELAEANRKLAALTEANASLAQEKNSLQMQMKKLSAPDSASAALRDENAILKKQIAELKTKPTPAAPDEALQRKLQESQAQLAALQSDKEILRMEKIALENKVKQMVTNTNAVASAPMAPSTPAPAPASPTTPPETLDSVTASKLAQLEAQRDELQKSLDAALRDVKGRRKGKETAARLDDMTRQLAALRARIQVFEASPVPYTAEEAALFSKPGAALTASAHISARKTKEPPAAAQVLLTQGQRFFVAHEYEKAEEKYLEALKLDPKNSVMLSDIASIQLQENHLADSEKNIKAALAVQPDDAFSQMVLGQLKFQQKNYDEAFDALSRAAQMNPQNARIQNMLGLTLSEKGLRGPAETAFRKAIQLDPGFADAHINLAVVYATQQPPLIELARWHYQKALGAGQAASPNLEKMLDPSATTKK